MHGNVKYNCVLKLVLIRDITVTGVNLLLTYSVQLGVFVVHFNRGF